MNEPEEGLNWPGLSLGVAGGLLLVHSLLLKTSIQGASNLALMHHQQLMLICAIGLLILGALGWLFGKKSPLPEKPVLHSRLSGLAGGFLALLALTYPVVEGHPDPEAARTQENMLILAALLLGYAGLARSSGPLRKTLVVTLGTGVAALVLQRSFDPVPSHYLFAGTAGGFAAGLITHTLAGSRPTGNSVSGPKMKT